MNALVLYESYSGFTERYARWIGEALDAAVMPLKECTPELAAQADLLIFGGGVRGGIIRGQTKAARLFRRCGTKPVLWFAVGIRPMTARTLDLVRKNNFSEGEAFFYFRGGMEQEKLKPGDKTMITCYRAMMKRRQASDSEDQEVISLLRTNCDYTDRALLAPLLRRARELVP